MPNEIFIVDMRNAECYLIPTVHPAADAIPEAAEPENRATMADAPSATRDKVIWLASHRCERSLTSENETTRSTKLPNREGHFAAFMPEGYPAHLSARTWSRVRYLDAHFRNWLHRGENSDQVVFDALQLCFDLLLEDRSERGELVDFEALRQDEYNSPLEIAAALRWLPTEMASPETAQRSRKWLREFIAEEPEPPIRREGSAPSANRAVPTSDKLLSTPMLDISGSLGSVPESELPGDWPDSHGAAVQKENRKAKKQRKRNKIYEAIDAALREIAKSQPKSHEEVFCFLDGRVKPPAAKPFKALGGFLKGFTKDHRSAHSWLSKRWGSLGLPAFTPGPK
jgi:hypothetical protein